MVERTLTASTRNKQLHISKKDYPFLTNLKNLTLDKRRQKLIRPVFDPYKKWVDRRSGFSYLPKKQIGLELTCLTSVNPFSFEPFNLISKDGGPKWQIIQIKGIL